MCAAPRQSLFAPAVHLTRASPVILSPWPCMVMQDKLRDYEKQIQELTSRLSTVEREKSSYELKCGEMEKVLH